MLHHRLSLDFILRSMLKLSSGSVDIGGENEKHLEFWISSKSESRVAGTLTDKACAVTEDMA